MPDRSFPFFAEKGDCFLFMRTGKNCFLFPKNHAGNDEKYALKPFLSPVFDTKRQNVTFFCTICLYYCENKPYLV